MASLVSSRIEIARVMACGVLLGQIVLTGCSTIRTEVGSPLPEGSTTLEEGTTRVETVVERLGPPHSVSALPNGFVFLYEHSSVSEFQFGISLRFIKLPYFKLIKGKSNLSETVHLLTFDDQGVLIAQGTAAWKEKLGGGHALQFIASVLSLTDTSSFKEEPDSLLWGRGNLLRPPEVLNSNQSLRSGINGVQLRATPVFVGQSTLEMERPRPLKVKRRKTIHR